VVTLSEQELTQIILTKVQNNRLAAIYRPLLVTNV